MSPVDLANVDLNDGDAPVRWLITAIVFVAVTSVVLVLRGVLRRRVSTFAEGTATLLDDHLADVIGRTRAFFAVALGLLAALGVADLGSAEPVLLRVVAVAVLAQIGIWAAAFGHFAIGQFAASRNDPAVGGAVGILRVMATVGVWSIIVLLALASVGVDVTAGIAGLGIGGIAVALAVQNVLGDVFASLSIVFDRPFLVGDFIVVGDDMGTVDQIGLKTTRLRSLSGEMLVLSNSDLLKARIRNYRDLSERRVVFSVGITYETPRGTVEAVAPLLREIISKVERVRVDRVHLKGFGASSLDFEAVYFVLDADYNRFMDIQHDINLAILKAFEDRHIEFAYPTRTLWLRSSASVVPRCDA